METFGRREHICPPDARTFFIFGKNVGVFLFSIPLLFLPGRTGKQHFYLLNPSFPHIPH